MTTAAIPYVLAGLGTAAQIVDSREQTKDQRRILNAQLARDEETAKKNNALILDEAAKYAPDQRLDAMAENEQRVYDQQQKDLMAGAGGADIGNVVTSGDAGNVSDDFVRARADRAVTEGSRLTSLARALAKTRAPGQLAIEEGYSRGNLASALSNLAGTNANFARAAQSDAASVTGGSLGNLGRITSGIGMGLAAGGFGAAAPAGAATATGVSSGAANFKLPASIWGA